MIEKVLIIADMLNDFGPGGALAVPGFENIVANVVEKTNEYRNAGLPVIFLRDFHARDDKEFNRFPAHCVMHTSGCNIIKELEFGKSINDVLVNKTRYSGFYGTRLEEILATMNPEMVEVCGVCASICVMDTVGGLANRDYATVVQRNCVADLTLELLGFSLSRMQMVYGTRVI